VRRREFLGTLGGGLLAAPLTAHAQQAGKVARIGYLHPNLAASPHLAEAFRQGLRDLGYVESRNAGPPRPPCGLAPSSGRKRTRRCSLPLARSRPVRYCPAEEETGAREQLGSALLLSLCS